MKDSPFTVTSIERKTSDVFRIDLEGDASGIRAPGQFANLTIPGLFLRRPISVCDWSDHSLVLLVREVGAGTRRLADAKPGDRFDVLLPLGNGFDPSACGKRPVLAGGGIGIAPLYGLAKRMLEAGTDPDVVLGFRNKADTFFLDEFRALRLRVHVATEDGSVGTKGFVTDGIRGAVPDTDTIFACGPMPMLRALRAAFPAAGGQYSFEARMGCGFGACVGCTIQTKNGPARVCKEGPVFSPEDIPW